MTSLFDSKIISIVLWVLLGGLFSSCAEGQDRSVLTYTSPNPQDLSHFGIAITDIEDINNDGVSDFLVGASWENVGETTNAGRAYLLSGKTGEVIHTLTSLDNGGDFGDTVSEVADIDEDGVPDLLVGAPGENPGGIDQAGRVYLFSGRTGEVLKVFTSLQAEQEGEFGDSVTGVGDTNGDGAPDLLIGAPGESPNGQDSAGRAYLFSGATGSVIHTFVYPKVTSTEGAMEVLGQAFQTREKHSLFGSKIADAGDVNDDGTSDFLISAYQKSADEKDKAGQAFLFSGADGELIRVLTSPNSSEEGHFGWAVAGVGDTNDDGTPDLLIGSTEDFDGKHEAGRAYLFSGATGNVIRDFASPNSQPNGDFGTALTGVGDVNGDGASDLLIGAQGEETLEGDRTSRETYQSTGRAYLFSGATGEIIQVFSSLKNRSGTFGRAVSNVKTQQGSVPAVLIGAPLESKDGEENIGRVYRFRVDSMSK